jgi:hypothetical protein
MTIPQIAFGPTLALAQQALAVLLHRHLAERQTEPATWYVLQLIAFRGPRLARDALTSALELSRTVNADSIPALLARLEAEGLIHGDAEIDMTPEGEALHRNLREHVTGSTAHLLNQFDPDDIATTIRTLEAITVRANEDIAAA